MTTHKNATVASVCVLLLLVGEAHAWGRKGHGVVAQIAEDNLTPRAAEQVRRLLKIDGSKDLASVASWADRKDVKQLPGRPMHTVRMRMSAAGYDAAIDCPESKCVVAAIQDAEKILSDPQAPIEKRVVALKDLVHFIGDVHQPLHAVANIGGQKVSFHEDPRSLHGVWDQGIIADQKLSYIKLAKRIERDKNLDVDVGRTPDQWAVESRDIAVNEIYSETPARSKSAAELDLPSDYSQRHWPTVERRLKQAGMRLAGVLNRIYN